MQPHARSPRAACRQPQPLPAGPCVLDATRPTPDPLPPPPPYRRRPLTAAAPSPPPPQPPAPQDPEALRTAVRPPAPLDFNAVDFLQRVGKSKPVAGVVEAVLNGSTLRVTLLPDLTPVGGAGGLGSGWGRGRWAGGPSGARLGAERSRRLTVRPPPCPPRARR
jgi:hypothetical protein